MSIPFAHNPPTDHSSTDQLELLLSEKVSEKAIAPESLADLTTSSATSALKESKEINLVEPSAGEIQQAITALSIIQSELAKGGSLKQPGLRERLQQVVDLLRNLRPCNSLSGQAGEQLQQPLQKMRHQMTAIATLSQQAHREVEQIDQVLNQVQVMVDGTYHTAVQVQQVESAVQQANHTLQQGDTAVTRTVENILEIRETVAQVTKKIKRLGEAAQKISAVMILMNKFTYQTQLLALNTGIEATRVAGQGRGLAAVADEAQSLAQQSTAIATAIAALMQDIQTETRAVSVAMDSGIQQVVSGTTSVKETHQSLMATALAITQVSQSLQDITQATQSQTNQSDAVLQAIQHMLAIAKQTSADSAQISATFQELLSTTQELQTRIEQCNHCTINRWVE